MALRSGSAVADRPVDEVEARFAYAIRRGNSFQKYDPLDFDLAQMPIDSAGRGD